MRKVFTKTGKCPNIYLRYAILLPVSLCWRSALPTHRQGAGWLKALGTHIIVELSDCNSQILSDVDQVASILVAAAKAANAGVRSGGTTVDGSVARDRRVRKAYQP